MDFIWEDGVSPMNTDSIQGSSNVPASYALTGPAEFNGDGSFPGSHMAHAAGSNEFGDLGRPTDSARENEHGNEELEDPEMPQEVLRRSKHGNQIMKWDTHKAELKMLYLDENLSLKDTMSKMKEKHGLPESMKWYKGQFKDWGWQKNLPGPYAHWMTHKASKRKRDEGKDTVFLYGGLTWDKTHAERSAGRSKKVRNEPAVIVVDTPADVEYKTPRDTVMSPPALRNQSLAVTERRKGKGKAKEVEAISSDSEAGSDGENDALLLRWEGYTRSDLAYLLHKAKYHAREGVIELAESQFNTCFEGYGKLFGPENEETVKVAFTVASFYVEQQREVKADEILEDLSRGFITKFGIENRRTQQVILQIGELLNGWNRQQEALAFLGRNKEMIEQDSDSIEPRRKRKRTGPTRGKKKMQKKANQKQLLDLAQKIQTANTPDQMDEAIKTAQAQVGASNDAIEPLLLAIINQTQNNIDFEIQQLQAMTQLLNLYVKLGKTAEPAPYNFDQSISTALSSLFRQRWDKKNFKGFETMESLLALTAAILKGSYDDQAADLFRKIEHKADNDFGWDDERTIWAKISIGIIYQKYRTWSQAKPWFDHACAASFAANGEEDGISMALEQAREKRHFEYLTHEGRPFKSVFGVTGLTIRPTRLHLD